MIRSKMKLIGCLLTVAVYAQAGNMAGSTMSHSAGDTIEYNLASCREMALSQGSANRSQQELQKAAELNRKAALAAMFPKVTANGAYMWNSEKIHLLANEHAFDFGTAGVNADGTNYFNWSGETLLGGMASNMEGTPLQQPISDIQDAAGQQIANAYQQVYDRLTVDMTHVVVAHAGVTQPIYTGGVLTQNYKIAKSTEHIAALQSEASHDEVIAKVDEAYWRVVSVEQKHRLADEYYRLLCQLESDVTELVNEGMATQSDLMKVRTKRGEAEVKKLQAENGLTLSRMALAQLCGLPLGEVFTVDASGLEQTTLATETIDAGNAVANRKELLMAQEAEKIARSTAKLASAGLQPKIVASAGYVYTNPNVENGVRSDWKGHGFFSAGVVVNVPIAHADDILRYKAAKHAANAVALKTEETRELLILQTTQANQRLMESHQKIAVAQLTCRNAAEVLRMAQESFASGMISSSELMQAQTAWMSAATDLVDAQTEAKMNEAKLLQYIGQN
ncbi:MAG: TolC family protein [Paludibacteraceae bacterium]|nr:TolC family protein [Paludibacteraceae bacterium]